MRVTKNVQPRHINLLLLREEGDEDEGHYVLIKNLSCFLAHLAKQKRQLYWCENCLMSRSTLTTHLKHRERCVSHSAQAVKMPRL
jgi:hypothetical protein